MPPVQCVRWTNPDLHGKHRQRGRLKSKESIASRLLVNWLNEILYLDQAHQLVCEGFHIEEVKNHCLRARVETRECDQSCTHIKAATFHNLKIREIPEGLEAEVVLDV